MSVEPTSGDDRRTEPAIATSGLSKDYGAGRGLFELDLEVGQGEVFGFLGPNGAGKSTTMRLLLDLIRPSSGSARGARASTPGQTASRSAAGSASCPAIWRCTRS